MKDPLQPQRCARLLGALAAPERLRIVSHLRDGPRSVGDLAELLKTPMVNVSHHLHVLLNAGLVRNRKQGRFVLYSLSPNLLRSEEEGVKEHLDLGCCRLELPAPEAPPAEDA
jgi:DNA-binding transcriptional ArsR family regulator